MKLKEFLNEKDIVGADKIYTKEELELKKLGTSKYKKLEDGSYEVWGDFVGNTNIINIKIKIFHGNFDCSNQNLNVLKNCPEIVDGDFNCCFNNLETLVGCPKKIYGDFSCYRNDLKTLNGCAEEIYGNFNCFGNKLESLKYGPKIVKGNYYCGGNKKQFNKNYVKSICKVEGNINT